MAYTGMIIVPSLWASPVQVSGWSDESPKDVLDFWSVAKSAKTYRLVVSNTTVVTFKDEALVLQGHTA